MILRELFESNNIVDEFISSLSSRDKKIFSIRDNCGPCTIDFISWAERTKNMLNLTRVRGEFRADNVVSDKADFTSDMKAEFKESGLDFNDPADRKKWIEQSKYANEWHNVPHYWAEDNAGKIFDPAGKLQFLNKLSKDLNKNRYIKGH